MSALPAMMGLVLHRGLTVDYNLDVAIDTGLDRSHHDFPASTIRSSRPHRMARPFFPRLRMALTLCLLASLILAAGAGCHEAEISTYTVPKPAQVYADNHEEGPDGMLAAMIARKTQKQAWFFKIAGLKGPVTVQQAAFREFLTSVRFDEKTGNPEWTLPTGWQQPGGVSSSGMRYATLTVGTEPDSLELTVIRLPLPESDFDAYLLQNVNRWRKQLRLADLSASDLKTETEMIAAGDEQAIAVKNMVGHLKSSGPMMSGPFAGGGSRMPPGPAPPRGGAAAGGGAAGLPRLSYSKPEGWSPGELEISRMGITIVRQAAFDFRGGDESGEVTVTAMPVGPRFLLNNVNRWRRQVALEAVDSDNLDDLFEPIALATIKGQYLELVGPRNTILGTIVESGGMTWFFKLSAPNRLAGRSRKDFKAFINSSRFGPGPDGDSDSAGGPDGR